MKRIEKGFSLAEALVVLGLIAALILFAIPQFVQMLYSYNVKTAATQLATQIRYARMETVTQKFPFQIVINNQNSGSGKNTYLIQFNKSGTYEIVSNFSFHLPSGVQILDSAIFSSGTATITFDTRGGATAALGTPPYLIDLKAPNDVTYRIRINLTGSVEVFKI